MLHETLTLGRPLDLVLQPRLGRAGDRPDQALAHALVLESLRWLVDLDRLIDGATRRPLPPDARARQVLRVALAGLIRLETPPHAAVATALPLVSGGPRRLVHAVLTRVQRDGLSLPDHPTLPALVATRWSKAWGPAEAEAAGRWLAVQPPLDLTLAPGEEAHGWAELLGGASLAPGHVRLRRAGRVEALAGYADGRWWVQDLAAQWPARLVGARPGETVVDLCAAPGGKTLQLAATGADVIAVDRSAERLARVEANLARAALKASLVAADGREWTPPEPVDAVLLDAPCSATGTARRRPDVLHRAPDLGALSTLQRELLTRASSWLKPGGRLIFATCSLEPEEGGAVLCDLGALGLEPVGLMPAEAPAGLFRPAPDWPPGWRSLPSALADEGGADAFFMSAFRKIG